MSKAFAQGYLFDRGIPHRLSPFAGQAVEYALTRLSDSAAVCEWIERRAEPLVFVGLNDNAFTWHMTKPPPAGAAVVVFGRGVLAKPGTQPAAVLAHEIGHVWLRDHHKAEGGQAEELAADAKASEWGFRADLVASLKADAREEADPAKRKLLAERVDALQTKNDGRSFEELLEYGQEGEVVVGRFLKAQGTRFMALHQFGKGKGAPVVSTPAGDVTSPDFLCWSGDGSSNFAECKRRTWNNIGGPVVREVSVVERHLAAYRQLARQTGRPVYLYFLMEEEPDGLYRVDASSDVKLREWDGRDPVTGQKYGAPQLFFPFSALERVATVAELQALPE